MEQKPIHTVAVLGLGYVGLPLVVDACNRGFVAIGIDVNAEKIERLQSGRSVLSDLSDEQIQGALATGKLMLTTDISAAREADAVLICVPTPLTKTKDPDLTFIVDAAEWLAPNVVPGQLIVLESTTFPGTTDEVLIPILENYGLKAGKDFQVAYSPERIDPGNAQFKVENTPKVVGGVNRESTDRAAALYEKLAGGVVKVSSTRAAEMAKLLENIFRSVNIALVNELLLLCDRMDINIWEVIDAAATKPFGFMPFYPGPGLGGHCIPIDPFYLSWKAREYDFHTEFIELAGKINSDMPRYVVTRVVEALNEAGKTIKGSNILILGMAYKRDVDDVRESPAIGVAEGLAGRGAFVGYHDPFIPKVRLHDVVLESVNLTAEMLRDVDCVVLVTDHSNVDYAMVQREAGLIFDTRNVYGKYEDASNVVRL